MATMVATAESGVQARIREAQTKVREREQDLENIIHEISGNDDLHVELQNRRAQACIELAEGNARANPNKFDSQIQGVKDRGAGLLAVRRRKEIAVAEAKTELYNLTDELSQIEQQRAISAEGDETRQLISVIETSIETRNRADKTIGEGIHKLRVRKYLAESNRRIGADASFRLSRLAAGMRP